MPQPVPVRRRRTRTEAARSRAAILDAAARLLSRPDATVEEVAAAAGVSRQTVYAHYPSRDVLRTAAFEHAVAAALAALDAAEPDRGPAAGALLRVLDASWRTLDRYPVLLHPPPAEPGPAADWDRHAPVVQRLERAVRRGQRAGEIDPRRPPEWLVAATIGLGHAAAAQVAAGLLPVDRAAAELRVAVLRVLRAEDPGPDS